MPPTIKADDFSDGLWIPAEAAPTTQQPGFAIPAGALLTADNVEFQPNGAARGRRGSSLFNAVAQPGPIVAVSRFYTAPDLTTRMSDPMHAMGVDNPNEGTAFWQNAQLCLIPNGNASQTNIGVNESQGLAFYPHFDVANQIPTDATIQRIEVRILRRVGFDGGANIGSVKDKTLTLRLGGLALPTLTSSSKADTSTDWPDEAFEQVTYGGELDPDPLWGTGWSAADINDPLFRVELRVEGFTAGVRARVDAIEMSIFLSSSISSRFLVAHTQGGNIHWETASIGFFGPITGGIFPEPTARPHVLHWPQKGRLFIADGLNALKEYNGEDIVDVFTDPTVGVAPKRGPYIALHKSRIYATEPTEIHYSVYASEVDDETQWRPDVHLNVNDARGGKITGLASFGDALIILKDTAIFRWVGDPITFGGELVEIDDRGCTSPDSVCVTPFGVIYVGREGAYLTDGQTVEELSRQIRPLFVGRDDETTYTDAVGVFFPRKQQYWLRLTQDDDTGYVLQRLAIPTSEGETTKLAWSRMPIMPFNCGVAWTGAGDEGELYLGDSDGFVWLRDTGDMDEADDITSTIRTRHQQLNENLDTGRINQIRLFYRGMQPVDVEFFYDQFPTALVTSFSIGSIVFLEAAYQRVRYLITNYEEFGRFVSVSLSSTGGAALEFQQLLLDLRMRSPKVWRL